MQQLTDFRQVVSNSLTKFEDLHESRFGPIPKPPAIVIDPVLPLQLNVPPSFHSEVQKYHLSSHSREILSRTLDGMLADYSKEFDDSCRKLSQTATAQLQPELPKIVEKLREGLQTHFESSGLHKLMLAVIEHAEKRPRSTPLPPPPPGRPKPFNKVRPSHPFICYTYILICSHRNTLLSSMNTSNSTLIPQRAIRRLSLRGQG